MWNSLHTLFPPTLAHNSNSLLVRLWRIHTPNIMKSPYYPARSVLFHKEPNGVTYRVPALLYLSRIKSFLAFCEERLNPSDSQAHLLVMRKGTFYRNYVEVSCCLNSPVLVSWHLLPLHVLCLLDIPLSFPSLPLFPAPVGGHARPGLCFTARPPFHEPLPSVRWIHRYTLFVLHRCAGSHLRVLSAGDREERNQAVLHLQHWWWGHLESSHWPYQESHRGHDWRSEKQTMWNILWNALIFLSQTVEDAASLIQRIRTVGLVTMCVTEHKLKSD